MSIIKVKCTDQVLAFENTPVVASGGLEEDFVQFSFCSQWDGYARTAVFWRNENDAYHVVLDEDDSGQLPPEVTADEGVIYFGAFGVNSAGCRRTTEVLTYRIVKGAITTGTKPSEPTQELYTQLLADYAEVLNNLTTFNESVTASASAATSAQKSATSAQKSATTAQNAATAAQAAAEQIASAHASRHASGGVDPIAPADIGAMTEYKYSAELSAEGWYRIGHFNSRTHANQILVMLGNEYDSNAGHGVTALITTSQSRPSIVILNSNGINVFKKFRLTTTGSSSIVVEFYYGASGTNVVTMNVFPVKVTGEFILDNFMPTTATDEYGVQEVANISSGNVLTDGDLANLYGTHNVPTAADVGARPTTWTPSADDVGAMPEYEYSKSLSAAGWYRICHINTRTHANQVLIMLSSKYEHGTPQSVLAMVSVETSNPAIVILGSNKAAPLTQLRLITTGSSSLAVEVYYSRSDSNTVAVKAIPLTVSGTFTFGTLSANDATDDPVLVQAISATPSGNVVTDHRAFLYRKLLTSADDVDAVIDDGVYVYSTDSPPLNAPFPNASVVLCIGSDATVNQRIQLGFRYGATGYCRFRGYSGSKYQAWTDVYTSIFKPSPADIGAIALSDKPSGTYTGNNKSRAIDTGGVGNVLLIVKDVSNDDVEAMIVHPFGAFGIVESATGSSAILYRSNYIKYENGILTISGVVMNYGGGTTYNYYCL